MCLGLGRRFVGNELAIAVFVHPTLNRLPDEVHLLSAAAIARILGRLMPFWYGLVFLFALADTLLRWHTLRHWPALITISTALWALSIAYTVAALVPINNRIASWTAATRPSHWKADRHRWDLLHRWRVLLLFIGFLLLVLGILNGTPIC